MTDSMTRFGRLAVVLLPLIMLSAACGFLQDISEVDATPQAAVTTPFETAEPLATTELPSPPQQTIQVSSLRLWIPPEIGARTEAGSQELNAQIQAYRTIHPSIDVGVEQKPVEGRGGLVS